VEYALWHVKMIKNVVCVGGGVDEVVYGVFIFGCFVGWCGEPFDLEITFSEKNIILVNLFFFLVISSQSLCYMVKRSPVNNNILCLTIAF